MPIGAMLRNLASMTSNGFLANGMQPQVKYICDMLRNVDVLKKGRIHPIAVLNALRIYQSGRGEKGSNTWTPVQAIVDALNDAFYLSFQAVEATGKNFYVGVDVSPSMSGAKIAGTGLTARDAAAALALVTAATEKNCEIRGFCHEMVDLGISPRQSMAEVLGKLQKHNWGSTNIAAPIDEAIKLNLKVDCFLIITDNDVNTGRPPVTALREYRRKTGINAKLIVLATCASSFSVADVNDAGMLDVAGFDTSVPQIINEFVK
jgi:60 kDa SS-A/Ro ribonucleoprotein